MNKDLLDQLTTDEQPVASKLSSAAEEMKLSPTFQWELETQLMDAYQSKKRQRQDGLFMKLLTPMRWAIVAVAVVSLLSWTLRTLLPELQPAAAVTHTPEASFEARLRAGYICEEPLAVAHGFDVFLTNQDKTGFIVVDAQKVLGEVRSFAWSPDGRQLALIGNTTGRGNILITDPTGVQIEYLLSGLEVGYLRDGAWSRDGEQFVVWSSQNNQILYLLNADGSGQVEKRFDVQILGTPQFGPGGRSIVFYGADASSSGLFSVTLEDRQTRLLNAQVEDETSFALSPNAGNLAYVEMDRTLGESRLVAEEVATGERRILGRLPIPKGSGSSIPEVGNLSWSAGGESLVFDFGRGATDRVIYLAHTDGKGLVKVADSAHAPAISMDGKCLAYISDKQVFLMDLTGASPSTPLLLADLPAGRGIADFKLDKMQWRPPIVPLPK